MTPPRTSIKTRRTEALLTALASEEAVIAIHGPRSVGKSTVLGRFAESRGVEVIDLDNVSVREAIRASPSFIYTAEAPVCIDEYQYVPEVLDALKVRMNRDGVVPGLAVITGSTRQDSVPRTAQALTGRLHALSILPLSQGEIEGVKENLIEALRKDANLAVAAHPSSSTVRDDYAARIAAGGFPLAFRRETVARDRWFENYVRSSIDRDAVELARIGQRQALSELLTLSAARTAQVLNVANLSSMLELNRKTTEAYLRLLEDLFLVFRLPAWGKTLNARATGTPKVHLVDSGLCAWLMRTGPDKLASLDPTALTEFGHLLETFVVGELLKQVSWLDESVTVGHWRTSDGDEVDLVIEFRDGRVLAFEVKTGERASGKDFAGLKKLRDALGERFVAGVVLGLGTRSYRYDEALYVMPVDRIWRHVNLP
ncbi:MAG: ATP-binding protein [Trueperaceae bacterium]|nr:ATP-binding protein [Trueperaceae bacterium]